jgi:hypothetical protein
MKITETRVGKSVEVAQVFKRPFWYKVDLKADIELGDSEDDVIDFLTKKVDAAFARNLPPEAERRSSETTITRGNGDIIYFNESTRQYEK